MYWNTPIHLSQPRPFYVGFTLHDFGRLKPDFFLLIFNEWKWRDDAAFGAWNTHYFCYNHVSAYVQSHSGTCYTLIIYRFHVTHCDLNESSKIVKTVNPALDPIQFSCSYFCYCVTSLAITCLIGQKSEQSEQGAEEKQAILSRTHETEQSFSTFNLMFMVLPCTKAPYSQEWITSSAWYPCLSVMH